MYGSETWYSQRQASNLNPFATTCYRIMLDIKRRNGRHILTTEVRLAT